MTTNALTVGLLLDGPVMRRWAVDAVERAIERENVHVSTVILSADGRTDSVGTLRRYATSALDTGAWAPVLAAHQLVNPPTYLEPVSIDDLPWLDDAERVAIHPEPADGFGQRLPASAIDRIDAAGVDVLFRRGFGILKGDVLTTPPHGVLSYHHGDVREYRGRPPGVWEFANGERTAGVTLQRLTETLDGGEIVVEKRVDIDDLATWQAVERRLFERSTDMLATACERLAEPSFEPTTVEALGELYTCPGPIATTRIELKNAIGRMGRRFGT
ncbi:formyltransferase family protein [Halovivax cerinus]|uniref:Formyltransferase family protein n=1 Tax=Halovivax cerinus TaxID=1487865 RepID=A0ABD5NTE8_9EURY|nr:formyltransferase family protein [Halovivax cerinus]